MTTDDPNKLQEIDSATVMNASLISIKTELERVRASIQILSDTLAAHVRQNIDTMDKINEYIGDQMAYRLYRQNLEESNLNLELARKSLELEYMEKKYQELATQRKLEDSEVETIRYEYEKQKLEIEGLRKTIELVQNVKHSTKDRMPAVPASTGSATRLQDRARDAVILTAIGTATAATIGSIIAFFVFMIRFYIQNTPP